ncbi:hypothetical protein GUJ93_ZPchr0007g4824 [Zizania palustris]|uniref:Uncharacterized protein n=1 Tax=Zizania palustris TaxID=103762 RepID=A0A8J5VXU9_ZIZPA|nr:hypothetical protein GUJ93_ZPchr0007g4824 [Zizania palustris]
MARGGAGKRARSRTPVGRSRKGPSVHQVRNRLPVTARRRASRSSPPPVSSPALVFFFQLLLGPSWIHLRLPNKFPQPALSDVVAGVAGKK